MNEDESNMHLNASPNIFLKAKVLRRNMTKAEQILWSVLRKKQIAGLKFRRQHPILNYILDFYCHKIKLGIELDGAGHENSEQRIYDVARICQLKEYGVTIVRYKNEEVFSDLDLVKLKILNEVNKILSIEKTTPRSPKGEDDMFILPSGTGGWK